MFAHSGYSANAVTGVAIRPSQGTLQHQRSLTHRTTLHIQRRVRLCGQKIILIHEKTFSSLNMGIFSNSGLCSN